MPIIDPNTRSRSYIEATLQETAGVGSFAHAVGLAIEAYANVETSLANLLTEILKTTPLKATIIYKSVQNSRSRTELIGELLSVDFSEKLNPHWDECSKFLAILAKFRNALVHWQFHNVLEVDGAGKLVNVTKQLGPLAGSKELPIARHDIPKFIKDCSNIRGVLSALNAAVKDGPESLPERFQIRPIDRNLAVLQQAQTPKEPKPPRPPSVPKLSRAQRRAKASKEARERKRDHS